MVNGEVSPVNGGLSQAAIGRAMNLSPAAMTKLKKQGMPVHSVEAALAWRTARQNIAQRKPIPAPLRAMVQPGPPAAQQMAPPAQDPPPQTNDESQDQARTRREIAEANLAELKLAELRGDLVRLVDVQAEYTKLLVTVREVFLQLPPRLVPLLVAEPTPAAMDQVLRVEIGTALRSVAEGT